MTVEDPEPALQVALKRAASALKAAGMPFALGGGYALWVAGAPEPEHDVDLVVPETEVEKAVTILTEAGFRIVRPPEDWLFKAYADSDEGSELVDVLHRLAGVPVTADSLADAVDTEVLGIRIPVQPPTPVMTAKLLSLSEHYADFSKLLPVVRATRERLDWDRLRDVTDGQPYAAAFLFLCDRLGLTDAPADQG